MQQYQQRFESDEDVASRRWKRWMAAAALSAVLAADIGALMVCVIDPTVVVIVTKLDSLIITLNGLVGSLLGAYMGFSYQAQWRNRSYFPGASGTSYTGQPGSSPYGR